MSTQSKRIRIPHVGPIYPLNGGVFGPITHPFSSPLEQINRLLMGDIKVVEVLDNGGEVELTLSNYRNDHNVAAAAEYVVGVDSAKDAADRTVVASEPKATEPTAPPAKVVEEKKPEQVNTSNKNQQQNNNKNQNQVKADTDSAVKK